MSLFFNKQSGAGKSRATEHSLSDFDVCKAVLDGNTQAFGILAARYQKRLYMIGTSFFSNIDDCEDFVQDVMLKAYQALDTFRWEATFSTWLMRIAYNTAVNSIKKNDRYTSLSENIEIEYQGYTPDEKHLNDCLVLSVQDAIQHLPDHYRICIDLYFFYEMSYTDIADVTTLPLNTIKSHIFRAKKILRAYLQEDSSIFGSIRHSVVFPYTSALMNSKASHT